MALSKGINSLATVAEADAYFENRLDVAAWSEADETDKEKALITATKILDELNWIGVAVSENQNLAFPRTGTYWDPKLGVEKSMPTTGAPQRVLDALYEQAYHLLNNDGLLDDTGGVSNINVSSISLSGIVRASRLSPTARKLIKPLLILGGSRIWWRSN